MLIIKKRPATGYVIDKTDPQLIQKIWTACEKIRGMSSELYVGIQSGIFDGRPVLYLILLGSPSALNLKQNASPRTDLIVDEGAIQALFDTHPEIPTGPIAGDLIRFLATLRDASQRVPDLNVQYPAWLSDVTFARD